MISQYLTFIVKLCLTKDDCNILRMIFKIWGNLGKDWELSNIESVISFSTRSKKIWKWVKLITDDKKVRDIIQAIYIQDTFPFTYDVRNSVKIKGNYLDPRHDVDDFKAKARVAMEFWEVLCNFKTSERINTIKAYFFRLFKVYLIDKPTNSIILTLEKWRQENNKKMVISLYIKNTITSINPLEC